MDGDLVFLEIAVDRDALRHLQQIQRELREQHGADVCLAGIASGLLAKVVNEQTHKQTVKPEPVRLQNVNCNKSQS